MLWHWIAMGPYHFARMNALAGQRDIELTVVESTNLDDHGWRRAGEPTDFRLTTLSAEPLSGRVLRETARAFRTLLEAATPNVVIASGYAEKWSRREVLDYAASRPDVLTLFWTESTIFDHRRFWLLEKIKSRLVRKFDGALAAGSIHATYIFSLGMPLDRVAVLGGCVDNEFFSSRAVRVATQPFFLYVGRFVPQKNLPMLLESYRLYRETRTQPWDLVLVGAGSQEVCTQATDGVRIEGLRQVEELPAFYSAAGCFVLPSLSEPWGLVVNEAMASGLPVLLSRRCGCAADLVREGENGFLFDPARPEQLAQLMGLVADGGVDRVAMGAASRRIVSGFTVQRFAQGAVSHITRLLERKRRVAMEAVA